MGVIHLTGQGLFFDGNELSGQCRLSLSFKSTRPSLHTLLSIF